MSRSDPWLTLLLIAVPPVPPALNAVQAVAPGYLAPVVSMLDPVSNSSLGPIPIPVGAAGCESGVILFCGIDTVTVAFGVVPLTVAPDTVRLVVPATVCV